MAKKTTPLFSKKTMALYEKACKAFKIDPVKAMQSGMPEPHRKSHIAYGMLCIIVEFINKQRDPNWKADYHLQNPKYWTWHEVKADAKRPSGFGFSDSGCGCSNAGARVAVRLCFGSQTDEEKYRKPLEELYIAYKL